MEELFNILYEIRSKIEQDVEIRASTNKLDGIVLQVDWCDDSSFHFRQSYPSFEIREWPSERIVKHFIAAATMQYNNKILDN